MQNQTLTDCELRCPKGATSLGCESATCSECSRKNSEPYWFLTLMAAGHGQMKLVLKDPELALPFFSPKKANLHPVLPARRNRWWCPFYPHDHLHSSPPSFLTIFVHHHHRSSPSRLISGSSRPSGEHDRTLAWIFNLKHQGKESKSDPDFLRLHLRGIR